MEFLTARRFLRVCMLRKLGVSLLLHESPSPVLQCLKAGDLVTWDPNGNGYYVMPHNKWYVEAGRYDEKGAGGGLGQWDRDHHFDVWGKVCKSTPHTAYLKGLSCTMRYMLTRLRWRQPFYYGKHGIQCQHAGCDFESGAGDV